MEDERKKNKRVPDDEDDDRLMQDIEGFWDFQDQQFALFASDHHHNLPPNRSFQTQSRSMDTTRLHNSEASEPPRCNLQEVDSRPLLGLKLTTSQALTSLLETRLSMAAGDHAVVVRSRDHDLAPNHDRPRPSTDNVGSQPHHQPMSEKLKASNFSITKISIGPWQRVSRHEGELTAKLYFAKRKLVWEFLEGQLKSKIEVLWSDITAINALMPPDQPGTLQIELGNPPLFFREIKPQPRKHTNWQQASDFTDGHAPLHRRHYASFPPGVLDRHYEKLLQCDQHLFELSRKPFPSQEESPYFNTTVNEMPFDMSQLAFNFTGVEQSYQPQFHQYPNPLQAYIPTPSIAASPPLYPSLNPIMTVVNFPHMVESARNSDHHQTLLWGDQTNRHNCFHEASFLDSSAAASQLRVIPRHHNYTHQSLLEEPEFLSMGIINPPFNQIQIQNNNPNLIIPYNSYANHYGVSHVDQVMVQNIAAHDHNSNAAAPPINWLPPTIEGSNNCGGVTVEQRTELDDNKNLGDGGASPNLYPNHHLFNQY